MKCITCGNQIKLRGHSSYCSIKCRADSDGDSFVPPRWDAIRFAVFARDGFRCVYCGVQARKEELEVDHCLPLVAGGENSPENIVTACVSCNKSKARKILKKETILAVWAEAMEHTDEELIGLLEKWNAVVQCRRKKKTHQKQKGVEGHVQ